MNRKEIRLKTLAKDFEKSSGVVICSRYNVTLKAFRSSFSRGLVSQQQKKTTKKHRTSTYIKRYHVYILLNSCAFVWYKTTNWNLPNITAAVARFVTHSLFDVGCGGASSRQNRNNMERTITNDVETEEKKRKTKMVIFRYQSDESASRCWIVGLLDVFTDSWRWAKPFRSKDNDSAV